MNTSKSRKHEQKDYVVKKIDRCVYGQLDRVPAPDRLKLALSIELYTPIPVALYPPARVAAMLKKANVQRYIKELGHRYA